MAQIVISNPGKEDFGELMRDLGAQMKECQFFAYAIPDDEEHEGITGYSQVRTAAFERLRALVLGGDTDVVVVLQKGAFTYQGEKTDCIAVGANRVSGSPAPHVVVNIEASLATTICACVNDVLSKS